MNDVQLFKTKPLNHQLRCLNEFGGRKFFALLAEQGTGKTWIIINDVASLWSSGDIDGVFVLAPNGVHYNWTLEEIPKHMPDWVRCVYASYVSGPNKKDKAAMDALFNVKDSSVLRILAMNAEAMQHRSGVEFAQKFCNSCSKLMIVVDEASDFKTPSAKRVKELQKLKKFSTYRRIMDGTLINNAPFDAFAPYSFLSEEILKTTSFYAFKAEYAEMLPEGHDLMQHIVSKKTQLGAEDRRLIEDELAQLGALLARNGRAELTEAFASVQQAYEAESWNGIVEANDRLRSMFAPTPSSRKTRCLQLMARIDARVAAHMRTIAAATNPKRLPQIVERDKQGKPKYRNLDKLHALIAPHSFRVLKKDCLDLPEKIYKKVWFDMTPEQEAIYKKAHDENRLALNGQETPFNKLVAQMKLMQITTGYYIHPDQEEPVRIPGRNPKLELLVERAKALVERGEKLIVWARFRIQIDDVCRALRAEGLKVVEYHGGVTKSGRLDAKNEYEHGDADVFVAQQQAGGKGLTIVAGSNVFYFSNDYSLRNRLQSEDRAHRIGQKEDVVYTDFCARDTVDAECIDRLHDKEFIASIIVGDRKAD